MKLDLLHLQSRQKIKLALIIGIAALGIVGCSRQLGSFFDLKLPYDKTDAIIAAELSGKELSCYTFEPNLQIVFNFDGSGDGRGPIGNGKVRYSYPGAFNDVTTNETLVPPNGLTPGNHHTPFRLSNGTSGTISKTTSGLCLNDGVTSGPPDAYVLKLDNSYGDGQLYPIQKYGCCELVAR